MLYYVGERNFSDKSNAHEKVLILVLMTICSIWEICSIVCTGVYSKQCRLQHNTTFIDVIALHPVPNDGTGLLVIIATPEVQVVGKILLPLLMGEGTFQTILIQDFLGLSVLVLKWLL